MLVVGGPWGTVSPYWTRRAGRRPSRLSLHSGRSGWVFNMLACGYREETIKAGGRWASSAWREYIRAGGKGRRRKGPEPPRDQAHQLMAASEAAFDHHDPPQSVGRSAPAPTTGRGRHRVGRVGH